MRFLSVFTVHSIDGDVGSILVTREENLAGGETMLEILQQKISGVLVSLERQRRWGERSMLNSQRFRFAAKRGATVLRLNCERF